MAVSSQLLAATEQFKNWLIEQALPLWATTGIETHTGGTHERLDAQGKPDTKVSRRIRVNARQIYTYCTAAEWGWYGNSESVVNGLKGYLDTFARHPQDPAVFIHTVDEDNQCTSDKQDLYDIAFHLLSCAARFKAFGDPQAVTQADAILAHIDRTLKVTHAGWMEGNYPSDKRRQNPHMHLFEAFMLMYEATEQGKWLAKAGEIFSLFEQAFFEPESALLLEFFGDDWQPLSDERGRIIEPGHMMEWVWLLRRYQHFTGAPVDQYCQRLYQNALDMGRDPQSGLIYDEMMTDGRPLNQGSKRCWPITEMLKASLVQAENGYEEGEAMACLAIQLLFDYYITAPTPGAYIDQIDGNNQVCSDVAPASTLYHLILACTESVAYCQRHQ